MRIFTVHSERDIRKYGVFHRRLTMHVAVKQMENMILGAKLQGSSFVYFNKVEIQRAFSGFKGIMVKYKAGVSQSEVTV